MGIIFLDIRMVEHLEYVYYMTKVLDFGLFKMQRMVMCLLQETKNIGRHIQTKR